MIEASMYSINNFSPADFIGGASASGGPADVLPYSMDSAGRSFREYLASLTSAAEAYGPGAGSSERADGPYANEERPNGSFDDSPLRRDSGSSDGFSETAGAGREKISVEADKAAAEKVADKEAADRAAADKSAADEEAAEKADGKARDRGPESENTRAEKGDGNESEPQSDINGAAAGTIAEAPSATDRKGGLNTRSAGSNGSTEKVGEKSSKEDELQMQKAAKESLQRSGKEAARERGLKERADRDQREKQAAYAAETGAGAITSRETKKAVTGEAGQNVQVNEERARGANLSAGEELNRKEAESRGRITVIDNRKNTGRSEGQAENRQTDHANIRGQAGQEFRLNTTQNSPTAGSQSEQNSETQQTFQVLLRSEGSENIQLTGPKGSQDIDVQHQLARELREQLNGDIVKRGSIMMRNNGSGEIRLQLKPEHLGQVRIFLSLDNNNIAGRILVENIHVKEAFDQNMQELYRTFKEHGFGETALNVSVGNQQRQKNGQREAGAVSGYPGGFSSLEAIEAEQTSFLQANAEYRLIDVLA